MDSDSLENTSGLQSLEAENRHLKNMLNRFVSSKNEDSRDLSSEFNNHISNILSATTDFNSALVECLKRVGETYSVDRVSVYSYKEEHDCFIAQKQWNNQNVQEYHPADLTIPITENPLVNSKVGQSFASSNLHNDLKSSLADKFEIFSVQSLLIIPVSFADFNKGLLILESCSFKREWYDVEIKEIEQIVGVMSARLDSFWYKNNARRIWKLNTFRNDILRKIRGSKRTKKSINETLKTIGKELGLRSVYIIDKTSYSNGHELSWTETLEHEEELLSNQDLEKLNLDKEHKNGNHFDIDSLRRAGVDVIKGTRFILINPVFVIKEFGGWLIGEFTSYDNYKPSELNQFWNSIAHTLSEILSGTERELEYNNRYTELLGKNRGLIVKEQYLDKILDKSPLAIIIINKGVISYVNAYALQLSFFNKDEVLGKNINEIKNCAEEKLGKKLLKFIDALYENGVNNTDIEVPNKSGEIKRISLYGSKGNDGEENSYLIFGKDITESYRAQEKLKESRERYQKIVESAIDGALIIDANHSIRYVNKATCSILDIEYKELITLTAKSIVHKKSLEEFESAIQKISSGKDYKGDLVLTRRDGCKVEVELAGTLIYMENQSYCYFTIHDISKRKKNEKALAESERDFRALTQNSPDIILRLNKTGEVLFFNQAFINRFKFLKSDKIIGKTLHKLDVLDDLVGPTWQMKLNDVFLFGEKLSVEQGFSGEEKELYFDWILSPEKNEEDKVDTVLAIGRNLTPRKAAERELMLAKEKAEESDKLKSEFLANISHELRTPLNAIVGFSSLLRGQQIPPGEIDEYVDVIHKNSDSLMSLINNIIDVAKIESGKISVVKEKVNIDELLQGLYNDFLPKVEIEHKGRVKLYYSKPEESGFKCMTDPIRLRQVLVNLIGNAIKFTIKGFVEFGFSVERGNLRFVVKDTGIGISEAKQKVIFQPFRKGQDDSDKIYGGTGIGLAICEKLVRALGGEIGLSSEKAKGSEFFFTHPIEGNDISTNVQKIIKISNPIINKNFHWPNKLMLLVDENSSAHLQMRKFIEKTGITLVSARTAAGASKLLMNRSDIHLVLMDMNFPDSDGYELVSVIKGLNKGLPVIAYSATAVNGERERLISGGFDACIAKPADKVELLTLMDQFLVEA